jgi:hypothetical protein
VHVARMREERSVHGFGGKTRRKETTWNTEGSWEVGIKMDLMEIVCVCACACVRARALTWNGYMWLCKSSGMQAKKNLKRTVLEQ